MCQIGASTQHYHHGQQYSITAIRKGGGTVVQRFANDAYGSPTILDASFSPLATSAKGNRYA